MVGVLQHMQVPCMAGCTTDSIAILQWPVLYLLVHVAWLLLARLRRSRGQQVRWGGLSKGRVEAAQRGRGR